MSSGRIHLALRAPEGDQRDDPFAPPPEGAPDRPWQPRQQPGPGQGQGPGPASGQGSGQGPGHGPGGSDPGSGSGGSAEGSGGSDSDETGDGAPGTPPASPPAWGSQWSRQQPQSGRQDPFTRRPEDGPSGPQGTGPRFDPTDPAQRRSRYALVCGGWGLIFALLGWTGLALLLGSLALYWGVSALRMSPEDRESARATAASALADAAQSPRPAPPAQGPDAQRSFLTAVWCGIITASVTLAIVAATYAFQFAYRDYYNCKADALTTPASQACERLLPSPFRDLPAFTD